MGRIEWNEAEIGGGGGGGKRSGKGEGEREEEVECGRKVKGTWRGRIKD